MAYDTIDVVIPARNEQGTISDILTVLSGHPAIGSIIVGIDADSIDNTETLLIQKWCHLPNLFLTFGEKGKGQVVKKCLNLVMSPSVMFCDADITGLTYDHVSELLADTVIDDDANHAGMTIGVPDFPPNYPRQRMWAWPWVSGQRVVPTALVRPLNLHGYLMEVQINTAVKHASLPLHFVWLEGVKSKYQMSELRVNEMQRDAQWGREHGVL